MLKILSQGFHGRLDSRAISPVSHSDALGMLEVRCQRCSQPTDYIFTWMISRLAVFYLIFPFLWLLLCVTLCCLTERFTLVVFLVLLQQLERFKHAEGIKGFGPWVASSSHPCAWFLLSLLVSAVPALLFLLMCKWLDRRIEEKHKHCFLSRFRTRSHPSSSLTAI